GFIACAGSQTQTGCQPSSTRGWITTPLIGRWRGMCAHKDGVEDAGEGAYAQERHAGQADRPRGDDRGDGNVPCGELSADAADRAAEVEEVPGLLCNCETDCRMRHEQKQKRAPRKRDDEGGSHIGLDIPQRSSRSPQVRVVK